jgi:hypothetical protein
MSLKPIFLAAKYPQNRENTPVYPAILGGFFAQKSQFSPHALVSGQALIKENILRGKEKITKAT